MSRDGHAGRGFRLSPPGPGGPPGEDGKAGRPPGGDGKTGGASLTGLSALSGNYAPGAPGFDGAPGLEEELLKNPGTFSYFQAIRVIRQARAGSRGTMSSLVRRGLKIRADAALGFPGSDLVGAERLDGRRGPAGPGETPAQDGRGRTPAPYGPPPGRPSPAGAPPDGPFPPAGTPGGPGGERAPGAAGPLPDILDGGGAGYGEYPSPLFRLTVTFMGLYGAASPLPHFYAEEVLQDELNDERAVRELLDLLSLSSYRSHALAYFYSLLPFRVLEVKDPAARAILFSLMGEEYREESRPDDFKELKLFATKIRSSGGLLSLLRAAAPGTPLALEENVPRWVEIPEGQRGALGSPTGRLGQSALLGVKAKDLAGKFRLRAEARDTGELEGLMPGGRAFGAVSRAVARYLEAPLVWDLEIHLPRGAAKGVTLGAGEGRLGLSAFLAPGDGPEGQYVLNRMPEGAYV